MTLNEVVIVSALRTPIGAFNGALKDVSAIDLGALAIKSVLKESQINIDDVDEVIMGNVLQAGLGQNPARQASIKAGLPNHVPAFTINKVCGSGLKSVHLAAQSIMLDETDVVVAGGMENMSRAPYLLEGVREGYRMGDKTAVDSMITDGLWCAFNDYHMGVTAENINTEFNQTREEQDKFASLSQAKAAKAQKEGKFNDEMIPVEIPKRRGEPVIVSEDEYNKPGTTEESLGKLRPAFKKEGSVTAGNSSGINDGAAAVLLMSRQKADDLGLTPLATIAGNASVGLDPKVMGLGPIESTKKVLAKTNLKVTDLDLIEANEAFAAQSLAVGKTLEFPAEKLNVNGGAIALGHPIGASGTRILVTLIHELKRRDGKYGLATLCIGGGQGIATLIKRD